MVRALHAAGIEVILDVVYNHTAEGNHTGPTSASAASTTCLLPPRPRRPAQLRQRQRLRQQPQPRITRRCCRWSSTACVTGLPTCTSTASASISRSASAARPHGFDSEARFSEPFDRMPICHRSSSSPSPGTSARVATSSVRFHRLGRMERSFSRQRCGATGAAMPASCRSSRAACTVPATCSSTTTGVRRQHQPGHQSRRFHACRPGQLQRTSQRSQWRKEQGWASR